jgi:hypothetical protein
MFMMALFDDHNGHACWPLLVPLALLLLYDQE